MKVNSVRPARSGDYGDMDRLLAEIRGCQLCADLPLGPRPVVQIGRSARIVIAGQAPGRKAHSAGIPFDDASGRRLRDWLGVDEETFYDRTCFAIVPMGFCFPGTGKGGDLPPRPECAPAWRQKVLSGLNHVDLTLVIGRYALDWHLPGQRGRTLTDTVSDWRQFWPRLCPLPHPSPRNAIWVRRNPWFETDLLPALRRRISDILFTSPAK